MLVSQCSSQFLSVNSNNKIYSQKILSDNSSNMAQQSCQQQYSHLRKQIFNLPLRGLNKSLVLIS